MSTITIEQQNKIQEFVNTHHLTLGLGTKEKTCSIAAINLCLTGELTDEIPTCMSRVIGTWIINIQDSMPDEMRNSQEWKSLLPLAAGTERDKEQEIKELILDWMWNCLIEIQPIADKNNFGTEWKAMTDEKTSSAADAAARAAGAADARAAADATRAARAADAAADAARAARAAGAAGAAGAAARAARAAGAAGAYWIKINPCKLLKQLVCI